MMCSCLFQGTDGSSMARRDSGQSRRSRSGTTSRTLTRSSRSGWRRAGSQSRASSSTATSSRATQRASFNRASPREAGECRPNGHRREARRLLSRAVRGRGRQAPRRRAWDRDSRGGRPDPERRRGTGTRLPGQPHPARRGPGRRALRARVERFRRHVKDLPRLAAGPSRGSRRHDAAGGLSGGWLAGRGGH